MTPVTAQAGSGPSDLWLPGEQSLGSVRTDEPDPGPAFWMSDQPMALVDAQRDGHPIILVNDAFLHTTGHSAHEVVGQDGSFLMGPDMDPGAARRLQAAVANGTGLRIQILAYRKGGDSLRGSLAVSPVRSRNGDNLYALLALTDVSRVWELEQESAMAKAALDEARARLRQLEAELEQETVLLHEADHRIKNSLQMASSLVLLNARRTGNDDVRRVLQNLAERMAALSSAHRMLERAGNAVRLDMGSLVAELAGELSSLVPAGQVDLETSIEPTTVAASRGAPVALLANELIGNAFKHAFPDGRKGRVRIALSKAAEEVRFTIEDDGVGLSGTSLPEGGFGRVLIDVLARQLRARLEWQDAAPGTRVTIRLPLDAEELLV
jgi:PAS domain S-box-containing protein